MSDKLLDNIVRGGEYKPTFILPTPSNKVNEHLNNGGIPSNSFIQIQGKGESTFKTSLCLQMLVTAQHMGLNVGYIDAEIAMDHDWARGFGINTDEWFYTQPTSGESAWELCYAMIEDYDCKIVILDSLDAMQPSVLQENEVGDSSIGNAARLHSKGVRKLLPKLAEHHAIVIAINHKKVNITPMGARGFSAGGGKALSFYSRLILELSTGSANSKKGEDIIDLDIFIEKNKLGRSYIPVKEKVEQGKGIVPEYGILEEGLKNGTFVKAGSWFKLAIDPETGEVFDKEGQPAIGQGVPAAIEWIRENMEKFNEN